MPAAALLPLQVEAEVMLLCKSLEEGGGLSAPEVDARCHAKRAELIESYEETYLNPWEATDRGYVDDVIDPAETRVKLVAALEILRTKREELPNRKHGNIPL